MNSLALLQYVPRVIGVFWYLLLFCYLIGNLQAPKLQSMDEEVLKAMSKYLTLKKYVEGSSSSNEVSSRLLETGHFYGEELLDWVKVSLFPSLLPLSTSAAVLAVNDVEARLLMASDLCAVAAFYCEHFSESTFSPPPVDVRFNSLGLANVPYESTLHIQG
ncbi:unnamed protein product [Prunus armeniaca]